MKRLVLIAMVMLLQACHQSDHGGASAAKQSGTYTVSKQAYPTNLYFTSTMEPIASMVVPTSYAGVIEKKMFKYGDVVHKGDVLFVIKSSQLASKYRNEITQYLNSKNTYETNVSAFNSDKVLYKAELIDRNTYESSRNTVQTSLLSFINQEQSLHHFMKPLPASAQFDMHKLFLKNIDFVTKVLKKPLSHITVRAPMTGVALLPKGENKAGSALAAGDSVKQDQNLTRIGDMSGLLLRFSVSENKVNRIKVGQRVSVTSPALPGTQFEGKVVAISSQATPGGASASFPAIAEIQHLSQSNAKHLRVGISAQLQMQLPNPPAIYIPIKAVHVRNGAEQVQVLKDGKKQWVRVSTGKTTYNKVEVTSGLQVGQVIALPEQGTP